MVGLCIVFVVALSIVLYCGWSLCFARSPYKGPRCVCAAQCPPVDTAIIIIISCDCDTEFELASISSWLYQNWDLFGSFPGFSLICCVTVFKNKDLLLRVKTGT